MCIFHTWGCWETTQRGSVLKHTDDVGLPIYPPEKPRIVGTYEYQRRTCLLCGKSQLRETQS